MLKKPSSRRKSRGTEELELPLVPIMDAFVTLIAFLLLVTSLLAVTLIDTPAPVVSNVPDDNKDKKPLMLTLDVKETGLRLYSTFRRIPEQSFPKVELGYDLEKLHEAIVAIKQQFPEEKTIVFMPTPEVKYDELVQIMDAVRVLTKTDPPLFVKGEDGIDRPEEHLFGNVIFGNVLSGN
ncbi:MAG: biopolymer transporter ExbD [Oligoflexia bacterium]|nr:biopolymer transporter ExbD [Oligoflexia bacterium]